MINNHEKSKFEYNRRPSVELFVSCALNLRRTGKHVLFYSMENF